MTTGLDGAELAAGGGAGAAAACVGDGSRALTTYATTTATITSGIDCTPSCPSSNVASITEVSGRVSIDAHIAPMPMATAGTMLIPGSCAAAIPPAAPMNIDGNTGPPR